MSAPAKFGRDELKSMGRQLRDVRENQGMSLTRLSELSGVSLTAIRALEAGQSSPSLYTVLAIVEVLGVSLDQLVRAARSNPVRAVHAAPLPVRDDVRELGSSDLTQDLAQPAMRGTVIDLPPKSVQPVEMPQSSRPTFCMVLREGAIVTLSDGRKVRLAAGDSYHAMPGEVSGWGNPTARPARLLVVTDVSRGLPVDVPGASGHPQGNDTF